MQVPMVWSCDVGRRQGGAENQCVASRPARVYARAHDLLVRNTLLHAAGACLLDALPRPLQPPAGPACPGRAPCLAGWVAGRRHHRGHDRHQSAMVQVPLSSLRPHLSTAPGASSRAGCSGGMPAHAAAPALSRCGSCGAAGTRRGGSGRTRCWSADACATGRLAVMWFWIFEGLVIIMLIIMLARERGRG